MEEREDGMREQNRRDTSRVRRMKDVNVLTLRSTILEKYRRWKKSLLWWSECTQIPLEPQATHVIMNRITNAELNEAITMDRDEAQTELGTKKVIVMLDEYLTPNPYLNLAQTYRQ